MSELRDGQGGLIRLGAIPVSLPVVALITAPLTARHPRVHFKVTSLTSVEIQRGVDDFSLDAALTYLDNERLSNVHGRSRCTGSDMSSSVTDDPNCGIGSR